MSGQSLSSLVLPGPLQLDGNEDFVNLQQDLNSDRLTSVLIRLAQTIAKNGKVVNAVNEDVQGLRGLVEAQVAKLSRAISVVDETLRLVREQSQRNTEEVKALNEFAIRRAEFQSEIARVMTTVERCAIFVDSFEGENSGIKLWVRSFMEAAFPTWSELISNSLFGRVERETSVLKQTFNDSLLRDRDEMKDRLTGMILELDGRTSRRFTDAEEHQNALDADLKLVQGRATALESWLDGVAKSLDGCKEQVTWLTTTAVPRIDQLELCVDDVAQFFGTTLSAVHATVHAPMSLGSADAPRLNAVLSLPFAQKIVSDATIDCQRQVSALHATLSTMVQQHVTHLQKELNDKVGLTTLQSLLDKYRDQHLYRMVDAHTAELDTLRTSKVDHGKFDAGIKQLANEKADRTAVDSKADRQYVAQVVRTALERSQQASDDVVRLQSEGEGQRAVLFSMRAAVEALLVSQLTPTSPSSVGANVGGSAGRSEAQPGPPAVALSGGAPPGTQHQQVLEQLLSALRGGGQHPDQIASILAAGGMSAGGLPNTASGSSAASAGWLASVGGSGAVGSSWNGSHSGAALWGPRGGGPEDAGSDGRAPGTASLSDVLFRMNERKFQADVQVKPSSAVATPPVLGCTTTNTTAAAPRS